MIKLIIEISSMVSIEDNCSEKVINAVRQDNYDAKK